MSTKKTEGPEEEEKPEKAVRWHSPKGRIPRKVVRTYYDPKHNVVKDVVEVPKTVQNRRHEDVDVKLYVHVLCLNEELQKKYCRTDEHVMISTEEID